MLVLNCFFLYFICFNVLDTVNNSVNPFAMYDEMNSRVFCLENQICDSLLKLDIV